MTESQQPKPYMNPYLAGFLLGLVLLCAMFLTGRGLGASGALKDAVVGTVSIVAPGHASSAPFFKEMLGPTHEPPFKAWLVFEVLGALLGAFISGLISSRLKKTTDYGGVITPRQRWFFAALGGALFAIGAQFARGCTSGAALSGMAVFSAAGFVTMLAIFGSGYAFAWFGRKLWLPARSES